MSEINSYRGSTFKNFCSYLWSNSQNAVDFSAIIYVYIYIALRAIMPSQSFLSQPNMYAGDNFEKLFHLMPIFHTVMLLTMFGQSIFYLKLSSEIAKFLQLFYRALKDIRSFIIILLLITCLMAMVMQVQGVRFDDGGNFVLGDVEGAYDTSHNDYALINSLGVSILSAFRNAVGDLQMPTYDYWTEKYASEKEKGNSGFYPQYMIFQIWFFFFGFIFIVVLMALNFLIAIFGQSYEQIMDRQIESIIQSRVALNQECLQELSLSDKDVQSRVEILVMQTAINVNADSDWDGLTQTIKKSLGKVQEQVEKNETKLEKNEKKLEKIQTEQNKRFNNIEELLKKLIEKWTFWSIQYLKKEI